MRQLNNLIDNVIQTRQDFNRDILVDNVSIRKQNKEIKKAILKKSNVEKLKVPNFKNPYIWNKESLWKN